MSKNNSSAWIILLIQKWKEKIVTLEVAMDDTQESKVGLSVCLHCRPCASVYNCGVMTSVKQKHRLQNSNFEIAVI